VSVASWARFFAEVLPLLSELARELFALFKGDVDAAKVELQNQIKDYGAVRREQQKQIDAELAAARAEHKEP
jgi:hypothetical protein